MFWGSTESLAVVGGYLHNAPCATAVCLYPTHSVQLQPLLYHPAPSGRQVRVSSGWVDGVRRGSGGAEEDVGCVADVMVREYMHDVAGVMTEHGHLLRKRPQNRD